MKMLRCKFFIFVLIFAGSIAVKEVAEVEGDVSIAVLVRNCQSSNDAIPFNVQSMISSAMWTTQRINQLDLLSPLKLGAKFYEICNESDYYNTIFELFQKNEQQLLRVITDEQLSEKVLRFCDVLNIKVTKTSKYESYLVKASMQFLNALGWVDNITIFAPEEHVLDEFFGYSRREFICVKECMIYGYVFLQLLLVSFEYLLI